MMEPIVGTAGWSIPTDLAGRFAAEGSALQRYASRFAGVEVNSSFHRPHRPSTWQRWGDSVPASFRFAVKVPKTITHQKGLTDCAAEVDAFVDASSMLGARLALFLVQLPPKLAFDPDIAKPFFRHLAASGHAGIVCEPRHPSWFDPDAEALLRQLKVARAAADPAVVPEAASPGGWEGIAYLRLHGSPVTYRSAYGERVKDYASVVRAAAASGRPTWCMFDNTASSAATADALSLMERL